MIMKNAKGGGGCVSQINCCSFFKFPPFFQGGHGPGPLNGPPFPPQCLLTHLQFFGRLASSEWDPMPCEMNRTRMMGAGLKESGIHACSIGVILFHLPVGVVPKPVILSSRSRPLGAPRAQTPKPFHVGLGEDRE
ncbi:MAG: hypothetical protein CM15mP25_4380 [Gammaproteobacteria bacterium]|nr:MAG: hypothetical protein CM15mP25_4380 [Gammaproteobacteria bacterium]